MITMEPKETSADCRNVFFSGRMLFLISSQQCQCNEWGDHTSALITVTGYKHCMWELVLKAVWQQTVNICT